MYLTPLSCMLKNGFSINLMVFDFTIEKKKYLELNCKDNTESALVFCCFFFFFTK